MKTKKMKLVTLDIWFATYTLLLEEVVIEDEDDIDEVLYDSYGPYDFFTIVDSKPIYKVK